MHPDNNEASRTASVIEIILIILLLSAAFFTQFVYHELPCPLCLLQRIGFIGIGFGLLLNISHGVKPIHYGVSMLSCLFTMIVSTRQIFLHISPGSGSYGPPIFGLHLYTWSFITAAAFMLINIILIILIEPFSHLHITHKKIVKTIQHIAFIFLLTIAALNTITTFMECGLRQCPDNPIHYKYVKKNTTHYNVN